jgi:hypothetical protein
VIRAAAASVLSERPQHLRDPRGRSICDPCGRSICICIWVAGTTFGSRAPSLLDAGTMRALAASAFGSSAE